MEAVEPAAGEKRPLEETASVDEPPEKKPAPADAEAAAPAPAAEAAAAAPPAKPALPAGAEEASLASEAAWLRQQNSALQTQLAQLQQQHAALSSSAAAAAAAAAAQQARAPAPAPAPVPTQVKHNQAWTEQLNPENGETYYWNSSTGESTYIRPHDFNPGAANAEMSSTNTLPQTKGPAGANLFVVRKMRRGEYDEFNDEDLRREFSKYGEVTRAAMTIDKENGWSKGFGFVSFGTVAEADAAMNAVHGSWMAGREMKVEKTHDN